MPQPWIESASHSLFNSSSLSLYGEWYGLDLAQYGYRLLTHLCYLPGPRITENYYEGRSLNWRWTRKGCKWVFAAHFKAIITRDGWWLTWLVNVREFRAESIDLSSVCSQEFINMYWTNTSHFQVLWQQEGGAMAQLFVVPVDDGFGEESVPSSSQRILESGVHTRGRPVLVICATFQDIET